MTLRIEKARCLLSIKIYKDGVLCHFIKPYHMCVCVACIYFSHIMESNFMFILQFDMNVELRF